ncbi:phage Tail Collar domain protein [Delftia acidovorans]|uniref:phage tail protein n=1 Tax=Delftia acidovorans TaxID=80866 RepID=UPI000504B618|nr:tail fiber protein [Delftia acidovorans]KFJ14236.1 phage Tail Collar domain protein [Delftia acidovorans]QQB49518.1 phage tail protein [Delftia acidovorans]
MADPFTGEIRAFGFNYAPVNWAFCWGQSIPIQQNSTLYSIIGVQFGGNGTTDFLLPDLRSRVAMGNGTGPGLSPFVVGEAVGSPTETLLLTQLPAHNHGINVQGADASVAVPGDNVLAKGGQGVPPRTSAKPTYTVVAPDSTLASTALFPTGSNQSHSNLQPYQALNFCICLYGDFPIRP